jgi:hypothetical protein
MAAAVPWTEQYRPAHLATITGQVTLKTFLQRIIATGPDAVPHMILHGPPGTGKTTLALAFAADLYPSTPVAVSTLYLNASDERTIETVRERICEFLRTSWVGVRRRIVIFDEVETMTEPAQLTLRALMDAPMVPNTPLPIFLFLCNTLSRIVPLIRSRALALFCGHLTSTQIRGLLESIQATEGRPDTPLPTPLACLINRGDMRAFIQRAQQGDDPNSWLPWLQRLLNAPTAAGASEAVWEDGLELAPAWILLRHVIVFMTALGIPAAIDASVWAAWLRATVSSHRAATAASLAATWSPVAAALVLPPPKNMTPPCPGPKAPPPQTT